MSDYLTVTEVWPRQLWELRCKAIELAKMENRIEGNMQQSERAEHWDAVENILAHYLISIEPVVSHKLNIHCIENSQYHKARLEALERDHYRCVLCSHTKSNSGGVESHHIVPRSAFSQGLPQTALVIAKDHPTNLATLCRSCHEQVHANWRFYLKDLLIKIQRSCHEQ